MWPAFGLWRGPNPHNNRQSPDPLLCVRIRSVSRQQRDIESVAYEHRQKILREEERLRNLKEEQQQQLDARQASGTLNPMPLP